MKTKLSMIFFSVTLLLFNGGGVVFAETATSTDALITSLKQQLADLLTLTNQLQEQILTLEKAKKEVIETRKDIKDTLRLTRNLTEGMSGDDIRALQEALASDSDIYPEALVTGYFGNMTSRAVKKFQKKYGIEQVGVVGPKTRGQFNIIFIIGGAFQKKDNDEEHHIPKDLLRNKDLEKMLKKIYVDDESEDGKGKKHVKVCHVPPGNNEQYHTIKVGESALSAHIAHGDTLGECKVHDDEDNENANNQNIDILAPIISEVRATSTTASTTVIKWTTNEHATSVLWYGTTTPLIMGNDNVAQMSNTVLKMIHMFTVVGLKASTTYYYFVGSTDLTGNNATSSQYIFDTLVE